MKNLAVIFAVALLLLFGCFGNNGGQNGGSNGDNQTSPGGSGSGASNGDGSGASVIDVASSTIAEIIAAGVPAVCEINKTNQTGTIYERVYLKGEDFRYEEKDGENEGGREVAMVKIGNTVYAFDSESNWKSLDGCNWMGEELPEDMAIELLGEFTGLPEGSYSCVEQAPGKDPFALDGKVCTFNDIISEAMNESKEDVSNKTLGELSLMNVSVVCDLELTENSPDVPGLVSFKLYLRGRDYKIEMIENENGETKEYAMIKREDYVYSNSMSQHGGYEEALGDCYWMKEKVVGKELSDFEVELKRTETTYACALEEFGDEKLETLGKVCTFEELWERMG
ncbi:MAG: hypothetical protein NT157_04140 [Candidatus Micrarchaeota archaeon]|nr:hypothetical protein [Candidatus Micrarchaeota archaeon]